tara:strand:- start:20885 stop:21355 length:471 start_codon:yes stop_codon:yes gene_type:complete
MISFTNETTYRAYWQNLALTVDGIDAFKYGDQDAKNNSARSGSNAGYTLWVDPLPVISGEGEVDGLCGTALCEFVIKTPSNTKKDTLIQQETKKAACSALIIAVFKQIKADFNTGNMGTIPELARLKFGTTDPIVLGGTTFVACAAELPFTIPLDL